jgi:formylglycine-generating enzyme required for sulfatase activity
VDGLFGLVSPEDLFERPLPLRHRLVFYIGHVEAFDWNLLRFPKPDRPSFAPELDRLFAFGIDPDAASAPHDQIDDWPDLDRISRYCDYVRNAVDDVWSSVPPILRHVAVEHRLMHAETLAYILHALPVHKLRQPRSAEENSRFNARAVRDRMQVLPVPGGCVTLGRARGEGFGWDNEFPVTRAEVPAFGIDRFPVTNGDWLEYVQHGGPVPHFWSRTGSEWRLRTMFEVVPLPLDWPVYVTYEQAAGYAAWRGGSVPTEPQWHRAAYGTPEGTERLYPWGDAPPECMPGNFDSRRWDPLDVGSYPETASAFGVEDLLGNGWEWTSTPFAPFPGFEPFAFYRGYSADFFDGEHFVLKGGSPRTDAAFLRRSFRNWFRRDYPYVFATFRCAYNPQ